MKIFKEEQLSEAVELLKKGGILVFPTETSYGLGCDATNQKAVNKIFQIKEREKNKPLLTIVANVEMAKKYLAWNGIVDKIATKYWPGALTIVGDYIGTILKKGLGKIPSQYLLADGVITLEGTLAVRVSAFPLLHLLSEKLGKPLVATSANIAGQGEVYDTKEIDKIFAGKNIQPDAILGQGVLPTNKPSTIISVSSGEIKVLRQGELKIETS